jgi:hypothetical protein
MRRNKVWKEMEDLVRSIRYSQIFLSIKKVCVTIIELFLGEKGRNSVFNIVILILLTSKLVTIDLDPFNFDACQFLSGQNIYIQF